MPSYKLSYFNARARGEIARMLFAAADAKFQDVRVESADWEKVKKDMPQGTMPVLEIDGKQKISQSMAVARYLAREFNLYGKGNSSMAIVDQIIDTTIEMFDKFIGAVFAGDEEEKKKKMEKFVSTDRPRFLGLLEDLVKQTGKSGFAVGDSVNDEYASNTIERRSALSVMLPIEAAALILTVADLLLYVYIENIGALQDLAKFPKLAENIKKVAELPRIKKYLEKRPATQF